MNKPTYAGKITNSGAQKVEAPLKSSKKSSSTVKVGNDLRSGKKAKK